MNINNTKGRHLVLAADGACLGNPGPGGWAVVTNDYDGGAIVSRIAFAGRADGRTTNNRMELTAAYQALQFAKLSTAETITIISDSEYVVKGATLYLPSWKANGWRKADNKRLKNLDLWQAIDDFQQGLDVHWQWTKGHDGHALNELADKIANDAAAAVHVGELPALRKFYPEAFSW
jgi:ribonuclease HI